MKKLSTYIFPILLLVVSCKEEEKKPKVIYEDAKAVVAPIQKDTTQIKIADLPIHIEGTSFLVHPMGEYSLTDGSSKSNSGASSAYDKDESFKVSNYNDYEITGYISNFKFQKIGSDSLQILTEKPVLIETVTYLKTVSDKTKQQILVYTLADMDTNKDGKINSNDIKTIYLSDISGNKFTKIGTDFQELIDWNLIETTSRLYFRTLEDINKNGAFDKTDKVHYHFINLQNKDWKVEEYSPIN
jgi:DNA-directed RNA polymerase beta subunit